MNVTYLKRLIDINRCMSRACNLDGNLIDVLVMPSKYGDGTHPISLGHITIYLCHFFTIIHYCILRSTYSI